MPGGRMAFGSRPMLEGRGRPRRRERRSERHRERERVVAFRGTVASYHGQPSEVISVAKVGLQCGGRGERRL